MFLVSPEDIIAIRRAHMVGQDKALADARDSWSVVPTYGPRRREHGGRWFRPRGANVLVWLFPADFGEHWFEASAMVEY